MGALEDVELTEAPPGAAATTTDTRVAVTFGCATRGPTYTFLPFAAASAIASQHGAGAGVKAAAYTQAKSGKPGIFMRLPAVARAAYVSPVDTTGMTGTLVPTVTGTPLDGYDIVAICTNAGTVGTTGVTFKFSLDGGKTFGAEVPLLTAVTLAIGTTGLTAHFLATKTVNVDDQFLLWTYPASQSVLPMTVTRAGNSTSEPTFTGTPADAYEIRIEVRAAGTVGTPGIIVRYSLDGGRRWTPEIALDVSGSIALLDGEEATGLTVTFGAGSLDAGDLVAVRTTAPQPQAADIVTGLDLLKASNLEWGFVHPVGEWTPTDAGSVGSKIASWASGARRTFAVVNMRDRGTWESDAAWSVRVVEQWSTFVDSRISGFAGYTLVTCPITKRKDRRPVAWNAVARTLKRDPQVELGRVRDGVLESDVVIHDEAGRLVEHDGNANPTLAHARIGVLRTYDRRKGVYFWIARVFGASGDIQRLTYRRILDVAGDALRDALLDSLEDNLPRWGAKVKRPFKPGDLREDEAWRLESRVENALRSVLVGGGMASDVRVTLDRTPVQVAPQQWKLNWTVRIDAPIYVDGISATYGITDPALDALLNVKER